MPKDMLRVNDTFEGAKGLIRDGGSKRRSVAQSAAESAQTTVLMTPEELDSATKKSPLYAAPGR